MVERQDIDALLISALYGELTPAEETRLAVHLDSHPGDRTALADLTHARTLVRESRLLQVQLEPPQSVSVLLMKEATRCAPKPEVAEGWFARFVRSFAAHPAMAAAAMLVLILGVATLVTKRKGDQFAESTAPAQTVAQEPLAAKQAGGDSPVALNVNDTEPTGAAFGSGASAVQAASETGALEAKPDSYRVALEEGGGPADKKTAKPNLKLAKEQQENGAVATPKKSAGIELRAKQAAPKDFDDSRAAKGGKAAKAKDELAFGDTDNAPPPVGPAPKTAPAPRDGEVATGFSSGAASGGSAPGAPSNRKFEEPSAAPAQPATASRPTAPRTTTPTPAPPAAPKPEPRLDAPAKTVDRNATPRAAGPAENKAADPQLAWARDQHNALIAQVRAGECKKAANIATAISNRAPAYYQQNVETDRSVKACIAYINSERERDAEQRAERARANQKRSVNEPAPAKPAPSKSTATDSTK